MGKRAFKTGPKFRGPLGVPTGSSIVSPGRGGGGVVRGSPVLGHSRRSMWNIYIYIYGRLSKLWSLLGSLVQYGT